MADQDINAALELLRTNGFRVVEKQGGISFTSTEWFTFAKGSKSLIELTDGKFYIHTTYGGRRLIQLASQEGLKRIVATNAVEYFNHHKTGLPNEGTRVLIRADGSFYKGTVKKYREKAGSQMLEVFVAFDDGDTDWYRAFDQAEFDYMYATHSQMPEALSTLGYLWKKHVVS